MGLLERLSAWLGRGRAEVTVLVLGLDNSGKSTLLHALRPPDQRAPTAHAAHIAPTVAQQQEHFTSERGRVVQRVGRVGRAAPPRAVGAPLPARARRHLRRGRRRPPAPRGRSRGAGAAPGAPRHVRSPGAFAGVRQQVGRHARAGAHASRSGAVPGAHLGQAVAHLRVVCAVRRGAGGRRGVARAPAARRPRAHAAHVGRRATAWCPRSTRRATRDGLVPTQHP